jgi:hypothetical protein
MSLPQKRRFQLPSDEDLAQLNEVSTIVPRVPSRASSMPTPVAEPIVEEQQSTISATTSMITTKTSKTTIRTNATSHSFTSVYEKTVKVNRNQNGNPVLKLIRNVPWQFEDGIVPDYVVGECDFFESALRFPLTILVERLVSYFFHCDIICNFQNMLVNELLHCIGASRRGFVTFFCS